MNPNTVVPQTKSKFQDALTHFEEELKKVRTGRANAAMLDGVMVMAYGSPTPLNQVATLTVPEGQLIQITPFDPNNLQAIASAIRDNQSLGLNPMDDGRVVRVPIPALTEERRREYVKLLGAKAEDAMISLRNIRRDAIDVIDKAKKAKETSEDDAKRLTQQVEDEMTKVKGAIESASKVKEQEIMTV